MTDLGWTGLRSACGQDLSFDGARFDELDVSPRPKPALVPHDVVVGVDTGDGPFVTTRFVAWCRTCSRESLPYQSKDPAEAWAVRHRGGAEQ